MVQMNADDRKKKIVQYLFGDNLLCGSDSFVVLLILVFGKENVLMPFYIYYYTLRFLFQLPRQSWSYERYFKLGLESVIQIIL